MRIARNLKVMAVSCAVAFVSTGAALAVPKAPVVQPQCSILSLTTSTACQTVAGNNDSAADMNGFNSGAGVFGVKNWIFGGKSAQDTGDETVSPFNLLATPVGAKSGVWSVSTFNNWTKAALVVKGGAEAWVAYLLDVTKLSGTWTTNDILNSGGKQPDISHLSLYVGGEQVNPPPPAPVPLPAAGLLLVGAVGGLAALRRRKARA